MKSKLQTLQLKVFISKCYPHQSKAICPDRYSPLIFSLNRAKATVQSALETLQVKYDISDINIKGKNYLLKMTKWSIGVRNRIWRHTASLSLLCLFLFW